jgi:Uma2 family endonuclease
MEALPKLQEDVFFTYADYKEWELARGERFELINGGACAMAAPDTRHQEILGEIFSQFHACLRGKPLKAYPAPFGARLFYEKDESDDTVVQPDISAVRDEKIRGYGGCRGAPDLVIEILSPANTAVEMGRKLKSCQDAGVREYWAADPENNGVTVCRLSNASFQTYAYKKARAVPVAIFPDLIFNLEQVFGG